MYHKTIHIVYEHTEDVDTSINDIIEWGSAKIKHDTKLRSVLKATTKANLKLNKEKHQL